MTGEKGFLALLFVLLRAATYSTLFIAFLLVILPGQLLSRYGIVRPVHLGARELIGIAVGFAGAALAVWCILTFAFLGKGTPAPFDPPRHLVVAGPYRFVRNPMYLGAVLALLGAALFYGSVALAWYAGGFLLVTHLFVIGYEEPALTQSFGKEYEVYRSAVRRWLPRGYPST